MGAALERVAGSPVVEAEPDQPEPAPPPKRSTQFRAPIMLPANALKAMECPICMASPADFVICCASGHGGCRPCMQREKARTNKCSECRQTMMPQLVPNMFANSVIPAVFSGQVDPTQTANERLAAAEERVANLTREVGELKQEGMERLAHYEHLIGELTDGASAAPVVTAAASSGVGGPMRRERAKPGDGRNYHRDKARRDAKKASAAAALQGAAAAMNVYDRIFGEADDAPEPAAVARASSIEELISDEEDGAMAPVAAAAPALGWMGRWGAGAALLQ